MGHIPLLGKESVDSTNVVHAHHAEKWNIVNRGARKSTIGQSVATGNIALVALNVTILEGAKDGAQTMMPLGPRNVHCKNARIVNHVPHFHCQFVKSGARLILNIGCKSVLGNHAKGARNAIVRRKDEDAKLCGKGRLFTRLMMTTKYLILGPQTTNMNFLQISVEEPILSFSFLF